MDLIGILFLVLIMFFVIAGAVRLAIEPLVKTQSKVRTVKLDRLYRLRDEGIISEEEISSYRDAITSLKDFEEIREEYFDAKHVLKTLLHAGRLTEAEYEEKILHINNIYNME